MDVQLPDGTLVQGVPDGMTKADLAAKLRANGHTVPDSWLAPPAPPTTQAQLSKAAINGGASYSDMAASAGQTDADEATGLAQAPNAVRALAGGVAAGIDAVGGATPEQSAANNAKQGLVWPGNPDATRVLGAVGQLFAPMNGSLEGAVAGKVANGVASAEEVKAALPGWAKQGLSSPQAAAAHELGLRNGLDNPVAGFLSGGARRELLTNSNADVGNVIARYAARVPQEVAPGVATPLTKEALDAALEPMEAVYQRAAAGVPNGDKVLLKLRQLRRDGFKALDSDDPKVIAEGRDLLQQADGLETFIEKNISPVSGTSLEQLRAARQGIAQNRAVYDAMQGEDINMAALGRMYRNGSANYFADGPLKTLAQFAENNGAVIGRRIKAGDTTLRAPAEANATAFDITKPYTWPRALQIAKVTGLPQKAVRGPGVAQTLKTLPPRDPNEFAMLPMSSLDRPPGTVGVVPQQGQMF